MENGYKLELLSFENKMLYNKTFEFGFFLASDEKGDIIFNAGTINLAIPYYSNGKQINIYNANNTRVLEIPVLQFADTCGNNICDPQESYESCSQDCPSASNDDYCDSIEDNICDPDCSAETDADCKKKINLLAILIALVIFLCVIIFGYIEFGRLKHQKNLNETTREEILLRLKTYITTNLKRGYSKEQIRNALIKNGWDNKDIEEVFKVLR